MQHSHPSPRSIISSTSRLLLAASALLLAACVAAIPIKDQSPKLSYVEKEKVAVGLIDVRPDLTVEKKPPTYIGIAHVSFGIPVGIQVYPYVALKDEAKFTLAQWLEQRISEGLQAAGATVVRFPAAAHADLSSLRLAAKSLGVDRVILISLDSWYVDINMNWVGSFDFDWGYTVQVCDGAGSQLATFKDSGKDVIKESASDSPRNMITAAYRSRLEKLMERPEIRAALPPPANTAAPDANTPSQPAPGT